jgi:hypothetical protein
MSKPKVIFHYINNSKDKLPHDIALSEENIMEKLKPVLEINKVSIIQIVIELGYIQSHGDSPFVCKISASGDPDFTFNKTMEGSDYAKIVNESIKTFVNQVHIENQRLAKRD